jgi:hypothetical protein
MPWTGRSAVRARCAKLGGDVQYWCAIVTARGAAHLAGFLTFVLAASCAADATLDAHRIVASLARAAPSRIAFTEARFSALLREPLIVSGTLGYLGPGSLERRVTSPYTETTTIRGDSVRIERDGEDPRTFGLKRVPELKGFVAAFSGLLAGDAAELEQDFTMNAIGDAAAWQLELAPKDTRERRRIRSVLVSGRSSEPRCFAILDTQGGGSVILVGAGAAPLAADVTLDSLLARCRAE